MAQVGCQHVFRQAFTGRTQQPVALWFLSSAPRRHSSSVPVDQRLQDLPGLRALPGETLVRLRLIESTGTFKCGRIRVFSKSPYHPHRVPSAYLPHTIREPKLSKTPIAAPHWVGLIVLGSRMGCARYADSSGVQRKTHILQHFLEVPVDSI